MIHSERVHRYIPATAGSPDLWWLAGRLTLKVQGADTDGRFAQFVIDDPRGTSAPLHVHSQEDEEFVVLEGRIRFVAAGQEIDAEEGGIVFLPRGVPHTYLVTSDHARALVTIAPAGAERFFIELGVPVERGRPRPELPPPSMEAMGRAAAPYGIELVGPPLSLD